MTTSRLESRMRSFEDARYLARRRLPAFLFQRYEAGTGVAVTLRGNVRAFSSVSFLPQIGRFFPSRDLSTSVLGHRLALPVMLAPVGALSVGRRNGESSAARAASAAGTIAVLSTNSGTPVEQVAADAGGPLFYQLYYLGGRAGAEASIARAKAAGCRALVVTMDHAANNERERLLTRRAFSPESFGVRDLARAAPQVALRPGWLADFARQRLAGDQGVTLAMAREGADGRRPAITELGPLLYELTPSWEDLVWIKEAWGGPLVVKGVGSVTDARRALDYGADAIVVSNHGGNGLDGRKPTLEVLPGIAQAVGEQTEVLLDGGIRRGSDVVKAIALGARAVLIGRAYVFALMAGGEDGVARMLALLRHEIDRTLASLGCGSLEEVDGSLVEFPDTWLR